MKCAAGIGAAVVLALSACAHSGRPQAPTTISDLVARPIEVRPDAPTDASAAKAMENYRQFLALQNTDPKLRAEAMRRLGDLNLESGQLDRMESELAQIDLQSAAAIKLYTQLLKAYPQYPRNDEVLYQLARAYETTGQPEQALATLDELAARYPASPQIDEVQFRRGEILFSEKRYPQAEAAYGLVIQRGPGTPFYPQSLYKHGWALFKQAKNEESLPSFAGVLDQALLAGDVHGRLKPPEELSRANRELVDDTLRVMSITFSYLDGVKSIDRFLASYGPRPYTYLLYSHLGDLYVDKQRYQDAAGTYREFVARDPLSEHAPVLAMQAIEADRKGGFTDLVLQSKRDFAERYQLGSAFWRGRDPSAYPVVVRELRTNLKDLAAYYHALGQSSGHIEDYREAARWYRATLESFPKDPDSAATTELLAETLFASHQYLEAATEYERSAYDYPRTARSAAAAYAALDAYQKAEASLSGAAKAELHARAVDSGIKFAQTFPEHPDSGGVLTRAAEDLSDAHNLPRALEVARLVLAHQPPVDRQKQRIAWTIIGQASFDHGAFADAENAYIRARELSDPQMRADLTNRIAAAVYEEGAAKQKAGDAQGAVDDFLRVGRVAPDSKIQSTAQYDAATQLINMKQWDRAIGVLEDYRREFPQSERVAEVTRKLAVAYAQANHPGQAAVEFERIAANPKEDPAVRREALMRAANLYQQAGNEPQSVSALERFVAAYPLPVGDAEEARERLATIAVKQGDPGALKWFRQIVDADATAGPARTARTHYLAAEAQLQLAAPLRDTFQRIRLVSPLKRTLAAKRRALESALAAYKSALDYQVAEVTTAATFEMAELYRTLAKDVMSSERPKRLSQDELEQYEVLLEDQAEPFDEQAIALHETNTARARDGLYDEWIRKSYTALAELDPARYGKTELTQDVVTTFN